MFRGWLTTRRPAATERATQVEGAAASPPMVLRYPSPQNIVDLFAGEWSSRLPPGSGLMSGGEADLFTDERVRWADRVLGPMAGMKLLELGPLEGGHSYMMHWLGVQSITAIESNARAFLRLLAVKELFGLSSLHPMLGDCIAYLTEDTERRFDMVFASGVLDLMPEPLRLLDLICRAGDRLFLWTHYFDPVIVSARHDADIFRRPETCVLDDYRCLGARRKYPEDALNWRGFSGGAHPYATWLSRDGILNFLRHRGMTNVQIGFDHPDHPNGPAFAVAASRE
jgi:hypothetical protein